MISLSGKVMATLLNKAFRLSGSLLRPPYPLPAGFMVTKIPALQSTSTVRPMSSTVGLRALIAPCIIIAGYFIESRGLALTGSMFTCGAEVAALQSLHIAMVKQDAPTTFAIPGHNASAGRSGVVV